MFRLLLSNRLFIIVKPLEEWHRPVKNYLEVTLTRPISWTKDFSGRGFEPRQGHVVVSLSKKLYTHCLVLVGSRMDSSVINISCRTCFAIELK